MLYYLKINDEVFVHRRGLIGRDVFQEMGVVHAISSEGVIYVLTESSGLMLAFNRDTGAGLSRGFSRYIIYQDPNDAEPNIFWRAFFRLCMFTGGKD